MIDDFGVLQPDILLVGCLTKVGNITMERTHALAQFVFLALFVKATTNTDKKVAFLPSKIKSSFQVKQIWPLFASERPWLREHTAANNGRSTDNVQQRIGY